MQPGLKKVSQPGKTIEGKDLLRPGAGPAAGSLFVMVG